MLIYLEIFILLSTFIFNLLLALFVYRNNPRSATNVLFGILSLLMSVWILTFYPAINRYFSLDFLFWGRVSIFIGAPQALVMFLFADTMPGREIKISKRKIYLLTALTLVVMLFNISPFAFTGITYNSGGEPSLIAGPGIIPFALFSSILTIFTAVVLYKKILNAKSPIEREQARLVAVGAVSMLGLAFVTILLPVVFWENNFFVPLAPLYVLVFLSMTAYAIIRHRFLDIRFIIARTVSFLFADLVLAVLYSFVVYEIIVRVIFANLSGLYYLAGCLVVVTSAILCFRPVENILRSLTKNFLFSQEYDRDDLLKTLVTIMAKNIDLNVLSSKVLTTIKNAIGLSSAGFLLVEKHRVVGIEGDRYALEPSQLKMLETILHDKSFLDRYVLFEDIPEGELKNIFRKFSISLAIPVMVGQDEIAIFLLGPKLSGDIYYDRDLSLLLVFSSEVGIAIENAKSYAAIKRFNLELEKKIKERTKALRESEEREIEKAKSVAKLKDDFVFVAAHELRAPVTAIRGFLELSKESKVHLDKDLAENLEEMRLASDHLNGLVNNLLEVARGDSDTLRVVTVPVEVQSIVNGVITEFSSMITEKNIHIKDLTDNKLKVMIDRDKFREVVSNLISNSIKYNNSGGEIILQEFSIPDEDSVFIEVSDNGRGIPRDEQEKIFRKFFRATNASREILGSGLGLFITRMLVEKMSGEITFTSVLNGGTTFSLRLKKAE